MGNFIRRIWIRMTCQHRRWFLDEITFDGDAIYECERCAKRRNEGK